MDQVYRDDFSNFHPAIFQNVNNENVKFEGLIKWKSPDQITVPVAISDKKFAGSGFHRQEIEQLKGALKPIVERPLDNTLPNLLFYSFFSRNNLDFLQNGLKRSVQKYSGRIIGDQSEQELEILMQKVYTENSRNIDEYNTPRDMVIDHIRNEVLRLDELVVNFAVPIIINEMEQYIQFQKDFRKPFSTKSLDRPQNSSISGTKLYRDVSDILSVNFFS